LATISKVEASVRAVVTIQRRDDGTVQIFAQGQSLAADGEPIRTSRNLDITDDVTATVRNGAENLLTNIENRLKTQWDIV